MLIDFGDQVTALEIKYGATLNADFFRGSNTINTWQKSRCDSLISSMAGTNIRPVKSGLPCRGVW